MKKNIMKKFLLLFVLSFIIQSCGSFPVWYRDGVSQTEIDLAQRQCHSSAAMPYTVMTEVALTTKGGKHMSRQARSAIIDKYGYTKGDRMIRRGTQPEFVFVWEQEEKTEQNYTLFKACMESACFVRIKKDDADLRRLSYEGPTNVSCDKGYIFEKALSVVSSNERKVVMRPIDDKSVFFENNTSHSSSSSSSGYSNNSSSSNSTSTTSIEINNYNQKTIVNEHNKTTIKNNGSGKDSEVKNKIKDKDDKPASVVKAKGFGKKNKIVKSKVLGKNSKGLSKSGNIKGTSKFVGKKKLGSSSKKKLGSSSKKKNDKGKDSKKDDEDDSDEPSDDKKGDDGDEDDDSDDDKKDKNNGNSNGNKNN